MVNNMNLKIVSLEAHSKNLGGGIKEFKIKHWTSTSKTRLKSEIIEVLANHGYQSMICPLTLHIWLHLEGQWPNHALITVIC